MGSFTFENDTEHMGCSERCRRQRGQVTGMAMSGTPNSGGNIFPLLPCTLAMVSPSDQLLGEMDDVFWVPTAGALVAEDRRSRTGSNRRPLACHNPARVVQDVVIGA